MDGRVDGWTNGCMFLYVVYYIIVRVMFLYCVYYSQSGITSCKCCVRLLSART